MIADYAVTFQSLVRPFPPQQVQRLVQSHFRKVTVKITQIEPIWSVAIPTFVVVPAPKFPRKLRLTGLAWQKVSGEMAGKSRCQSLH